MLKAKSKIVEHYTPALVATAVIFAVALIFGGGHVFLPIAALALIEVTFSFENAVINSQVLITMNHLWRTMFLTVGIVIAVFGVRLLLPLVLVSASIGHSLRTVLDMALHQPELYAHELEVAYPLIAAFGGVFLLMIGLRFFGEKKNVTWLNTIEGPLAEFNQPWWVSVSGAAAAVVVIYTILAPGNTKLAIAGICGAMTFLLVKLIGELLVGHGGGDGRFAAGSHGHGLLQFVYLELLDATFSFDGVIAAFAITKEIALIVAGLGIGAVYVRSMTVHLLKDGTLTQYRYLVHGAHYAILALALLLLASIKHQIPEVITGLLGLIIIGVAFESSRRHNKREQRLANT